MYFIDQVLLDQQAHVASLVVVGLKTLQDETRLATAANSFADLPTKKQFVLIQKIEDTPFFAVMRFLTVCAMFSNPSYGGNQNKLGWQLIDFDDRAMWHPPFGHYDGQTSLGSV